MLENNSFIFRFITLIFVLQGSQASVNHVQNDTEDTIRCETRTFRQTVNNHKVFVDKSLFIKTILDTGLATILFTAPRRFGKTHNLRMLQSFFEVEVDHNGLLLTQIDLQDKTSTVNDTPNYALFKNNNLQITKHTHLMSSYFGKFPVVLLDLQCTILIDSFTTVLNNVKQAVKAAYSHHSYLMQSSKLSPDEKEYIKTWVYHTASDNTESEVSLGNSIQNGILNLQRLLHQHFSRQVIVLIDEYDSAISKALLEPLLDDNTINKIINYIVDLPSEIGKNIQIKFINYVFITGISYIVSAGNGALNNLVAYKFLQSDEFAGFFGFSHSEFETLLEKNNIDINLKEQAISYYDGYRYKGKKIFTPWSLCRFLQSKKIDQYWTRTELFFKFDEIFKKNKYVVSLIDTLANNYSVSFKYSHRIFTNELGYLRKILIGTPTTKKDHVHDLVMTILYEHGYISSDIQTTAATEPKNTILAKIPNEEISLFLTREFLNYYDVAEPLLDNKLTYDCGMLLKNVSFTDRAFLLQTLSSICSHIIVIAETFFNKCDDDIVESDLQSIIYIIVKHAYEEYTITSTKPLTYHDFAGKAKKVQPNITMLSKNHPFAIIMELKYNQNAKFALEAAIKKSYIEPFRNAVREFVIMGINVDKRKKVSINLLISSTEISNRFSYNQRSSELEQTTSINPQKPVSPLKN